VQCLGQTAQRSSTLQARANSSSPPTNRHRRPRGERDSRVEDQCIHASSAPPQLNPRWTILSESTAPEPRLRPRMRTPPRRTITIAPPKAIGLDQPQTATDLPSPPRQRPTPPAILSRPRPTFPADCGAAPAARRQRARRHMPVRRPPGRGPRLHLAGASLPAGTLLTHPRPPPPYPTTRVSNCFCSSTANCNLKDPTPLAPAQGGAAARR
jgi:hypothetical protein